MNVFGEIANDIFVTEFDSDTGAASVSSISGWMEANLGTLNNYIYTDFTGSDPDLGIEEKSILSQLYLHSYYKKMSRSVLKGSATAENGLLSISEGDTSIKFSNKNELGKTYRGLSNDAWANFQDLIHSYNMYKSSSRQVAGELKHNY